MFVLKLYLFLRIFVNATYQNGLLDKKFINVSLQIKLYEELNLYIRLGHSRHSDAKNKPGG